MPTEDQPHQTVQRQDSFGEKECKHCSGRAHSTLGGEHIWKCSNITPNERLEAFIKCQRNPWISRSEYEYQMRQKIADELEELINAE